MPADDAGFRAAFVYDASLFRVSSIERFAGHLQTLLRGAVATLDTVITAVRAGELDEHLAQYAKARGVPKSKRAA